MKLILKNFRCHKNKTFNIPDSGLTLLSGVSGAGKSTIFNAIIYALYGSVKSPYYHGQKSCSVTLTIKDLQITRKSGPKSLSVIYKEVEYVDAAAQDVIRANIGCGQKEFMASSYVVQSLGNSVASMTPADQAKFIEILAFPDNSHSEWKVKFKNHVKSTKTDTDMARGKLEALRDYMEQAENEMPSKVEKPDIEKIKQGERICDSIRNYEKILDKSRAKIQSLESEKKKRNILIDKKQKLETEIKQLTELSNEITGIITDDELTSIKERQEEISDINFNNKRLADLSSLKTRYKKEMKEFKDETKTGIDLIESSLPDANEITLIKNEWEKCKDFENDPGIMERNHQRDECVKKIASIAKLLRSTYKVEFAKTKTTVSILNGMEKKLAKLENEKELLSKKIESIRISVTKSELCDKIYECPSCNSGLILVKDKLELHTTDFKSSDDDFQKELDQSLSKLSTIEDKYKQLLSWKDEYKISIDDLKRLGRKKEKSLYDPKEFSKLCEKVTDLENKEKELERLKTIKLPSHIKNLTLEIKKATADLPKNYKHIQVDPNEFVEILNLHKSSVSQFRKYSGQIKTKTIEMNKIKIPNATLLFSDLEKEVADVREKLKILYQEKTMVEDVAEQMERYNKYRGCLKVFQKAKNKFLNFEETLKQMELSYEGALGLERAGKEAEILAMRQTLFSINNHAEKYLSLLFDDPISVKILDNKKSAKGVSKIQLNTVVEYKGEKYSSISQLSGGEAQRVNLAFLLSVNEIIDSNMILLDECLNNLDAEINMEVLSQLREICSEKLFLVVSHEAVKGVFDTIVEV